MTKDQYLEMMEQMGEEPDWEKCPPDWEDFPDIVIITMNIFNSMGDRVYPHLFHHFKILVFCHTNIFIV